MQTRGKWFWLYFWLDEKVVRVFEANRVVSKVQNQLLFGIQTKTALILIVIN